MCEIDGRQGGGDRDSAFICEDSSRRAGGHYCSTTSDLWPLSAGSRYESWTTNQDMLISKHCYVTAAVGIFFSRMVGVGLMTLVFYSSRGG